MIQLYQHLDLRPIGIPQTLRLSQYDSDFEIIFKLENFDGTWILDTNTTAEVQGTKTDGHGYSADAVFDDQECTVTIAGDVQMTAAAGRNVFEIVLFHDGDRLGSKNFVLDVERAALDAETTQSDSQIKNFTEMVEAAEDAAETATAAAEAAEEAAASIVPGMSDDAKEALLACFRGVAWVTDQGQTLYDTLEDALYATRELVSISAVFDAGENVIYVDEGLNSLKQYTTVTALYNDGSTSTVQSYTLIGELVAGTNTITVAYGGKTTTITVTGVIDFYNTSVWDMADNMVMLHGQIDASRDDLPSRMKLMAPDHDNYNLRRTFVTNRGHAPLYEYYYDKDQTQGYFATEYYPIPVPLTANHVKIYGNNTNQEVYANFAPYDPEAGNYANAIWAIHIGWTAFSSANTIDHDFTQPEDGKQLFLGLNMRMKNSATFPTEPTGIKIEFSEV